jgi:glyoxylase-like metal-dependent hydrolase (beta-lactamase superfamily II)
MEIERVQGEVMNVNSFVVRGPQGAVVVDGMLTVSDGRKVRRAVDATGLPLAGVVITHPHPDHYAGLAHILDGADVPILATADTDAVIRRDDETKAAIVGPMMGQEWPANRLFPNQLIADGDEVVVAGVPLRVQVLGPGESSADTIWHLGESIVFAGDVVYNGMHAYLADGHWEHWLTILDRLEHDLAGDVTLHIGHGDSAGKELLARQRRYVETFADALARHADAAASGDHEPILAAMRAHLPTEELLFLLDLSIEPALAHLQSSSPAGD